VKRRSTNSLIPILEEFHTVGHKGTPEKMRSRESFVCTLPLTETVQGTDPLVSRVLASEFEGHLKKRWVFEGAEQALFFVP
jgi:hypothetical protein